MGKNLKEFIWQENKSYDRLVKAGFHPCEWDMKTNTVVVGIPIEHPTDPCFPYDYKYYKTWTDACNDLLK